MPMPREADPDPESRSSGHAAEEISISIARLLELADRLAGIPQSEAQRGPINDIRQTLVGEAYRLRKITRGFSKDKPGEA